MKSNVITTKKRRFALIGGILAGLLAPAAVSSGGVSAAVSGSSVWYYTPGIAKNLESIVVSGYDNKNVLAVISSNRSEATLAVTTTTDLTLSYGYTAYSGTSLSFTGTQDAVNKALATLTVTMPTTSAYSSIKVTTMITEAKAGIAYLPMNQHFYKFVPGKISGTDAAAAAATQKEFGLTGYLASITSEAENDFVASKVEGALNVWIGATDAAKEGEWKWSGGPDDGKQFWSGNCTKVDGKLIDGYFAKWATSEPNNWISNTNKCGGTAYDTATAELGEDCVTTNWFIPGETLEAERLGYWNDLPCNYTERSGGRYPISGYVVEFGSLSNGSTFDNTVDFKDHTLVKSVPVQKLAPTLAKPKSTFVSFARETLKKNFKVFAKKLKTKLTQAQIIPCPTVEKTRFSLTLRTTDPGNYYFYFVVPVRPQSSQVTRVPVQCGSKVGKTVIPEPISVPTFKTKKAGETITVTAYLETWRIRDRDGYPQVRVIRGEYLRGPGQIIDQPKPPLPGMPIK